MESEFWIWLLVKITVILFLAAGAAQVLAQRSPRIRRSIWRVAAAALLLAPIWERAPSLQWKVELEGGAPAAARTVVSPAADPSGIDLGSPGSIASQGTNQLPAPQAEPVISSEGIALEFSWLEILLAIWLAGAAVQFIRLAGDEWKVSRLVKKSWPATSDVYPLNDDNVRTIDGLVSPFVRGVSRPVIYTPSESSCDWTAEQWREVLAHERSHIAERDLLWIELYRLLCAALWFHPLIWHSAQHHRLCCEEIADQAAARTAESAGQYEKTLAEFALRSMSAPLEAPPLAMASVSEIRRRLNRLPLNFARKEPSAMTKTAVLTISAMIAFSILTIGVSVTTPASAQTAEAVADSSGYTSEYIQANNADHFFSQIGDPAAPHQFAPLWALGEKAKESQQTRNEILEQGSAILLEIDNETELRRWVSAYVLSSTGEDAALEPLRTALSSDPSVTVRGVAACALGYYYSDDARAILEAALLEEQSGEVRGWIEKALAGEFYKIGLPGQPLPDLEKLRTLEDQTLARMRDNAASLSGAIHCEMARVLHRANTGHAYKDKVDLNKLAGREGSPVALINEIQRYHRNHMGVEFDWRINLLIAAIHEKNGDSARQMDYLEKAMADYPDIQYPNPSNHSKYHHIVNDYAALIAEREGEQAAREYVMRAARTDPKFDFFFFQPWIDFSPDGIEEFEKLVNAEIEQRNAEPL